MRITLFGAGYVGLVSSACFADVGHNVVCVDVAEGTIANLNAGLIHIHEPGLDTMVARNCDAGRLRFTTDAKQGISHGEVLVVAVGTPPDAAGAADLSHVLDVATSIASHMTSSKVIVGKSTVPVGTADKVRKRISQVLAQRSADVEFHVVSNPEFLKQGAAVTDFMKPDRIVVGLDSTAAADVMTELYAPFNRNHDKLLVMDPRSAELTKYAANAMLATRISLMNELANMADLLGADIEQVRRGIGSDPRIGFSFLYAGCGYGGACLPKDINALAHTAQELDYDAQILPSVERVNQRQKLVLLDKITSHFGHDLSGHTFALWGLAFKPNTIDMREAPSRVVIDGLLARGATIQAYDPMAMAECQRIYGEQPNLLLCPGRDDTLNGADALVIVTEWNEFKNPDLDVLRTTLAAQVVFDGRNLYAPAIMAQHGLTCYGIGRSTLRADPTTPTGPLP